ncbi:hypothetical protein ACJIZ3_002568 [Penstemon smallii]|uniref:Uncharacterized protein n=1 Tax=Penstemon smallii TaxID=265156 RepID=A0ABD3U761_9LAMI
MSMWAPYPPCHSDGCSDRECCDHGYKVAWPELVGMDADEAANVIEQENPLVTILILPKGSIGIDNFCCNRVRIYFNIHKKVAVMPWVG